MCSHRPSTSHFRVPPRVVVLSSLALGFIFWLALGFTVSPALASVPAPGGAGAPQQEPTGPQAYLPIAGVRLRVDWMPRVPTAAAPPTNTAVPTVTVPATLTPLPSPTATATLVPTPPGYSEPLPDFASIDDLKASYNQARAYDTMVEVLARRYPTGHYIVTHLDNSRQQALSWAAGNTGSWDTLMRILQLVVHEMNHQLGIQEGWLPSGGRRYTYVVRDDEIVNVTNHETYPRSEIAQYVTGDLANMYKGTYLSGSSGKQGFNNLIDELNAYTHSLFTAYGVHDQLAAGGRSSHRDGLVTFMMYTQFYLRHAREHHPDDYATLQGDPEMRALVQLLWDRAMFILDVTVDIPGLALDPEAVEAEMRKPDMLDEIRQFVQP